jgi:hypothetical protein
VNRKPTADQVPVWEPPPRDQTPLTAGGAVVVARLTPDESAYLLTLAPTLFDAVHVLISRAVPEEPT